MRTGRTSGGLKERGLMGRRVNIGGPSDSPDEYWFECDDCEGGGTVSIPETKMGVDGVYVLVEGVSVEVTCPNCDGLGFYEGDPDYLDD